MFLSGNLYFKYMFNNVVCRFVLSVQLFVDVWFRLQSLCGAAVQCSDGSLHLSLV